MQITINHVHRIEFPDTVIDLLNRIACALEGRIEDEIAVALSRSVRKLETLAKLRQ